MKNLVLAVVFLATSARAADVSSQPPSPPQIKPTDQFSVTLPASAWNALVQATDSKSLSAEIVQQIQDQFAKQHPAKDKRP